MSNTKKQINLTLSEHQISLIENICIQQADMYSGMYHAKAASMKRLGFDKSDPNYYENILKELDDKYTNWVDILKQIKSEPKFLPKEMPCRTEPLFKPENSNKEYEPLEYWIAGIYRHLERLTGSCGAINRKYIVR